MKSKTRPTNAERIRRTTELRIVHHVEALIACEEQLHGYAPSDLLRAMKMIVDQISRRRHR